MPYQISEDCLMIDELNQVDKEVVRNCRTCLALFEADCNCEKDFDDYTDKEQIN